MNEWIGFSNDGNDKNTSHRPGNGRCFPAKASAFAPALDGAAALCIRDNRRRGEPDQSERNFRAATWPDPVQAMAGSAFCQWRDGDALWRLEQARSVPCDDEMEPG